MSRDMAPSSPPAAASTISGLLLEDVELDVLTFRGLFSRMSTTHPFVFLNACHLGRTQAVANFVNGRAPAVLEAGGSGYIGGLWPLGDGGAARMGARFYEELDRALDGGSVVLSDVLRKTRVLFFEDGDPHRYHRGRYEAVEEDLVVMKGRLGSRSKEPRNVRARSYGRSIVMRRARRLRVK